jgi:hypothetical protein
VRQSKEVRLTIIVSAESPTPGTLAVHIRGVDHRLDFFFSPIKHQHNKKNATAEPAESLKQDSTETSVQYLGTAQVSRGSLTY